MLNIEKMYFKNSEFAILKFRIGKDYFWNDKKIRESGWKNPLNSVCEMAAPEGVCACGLMVLTSAEDFNLVIVLHHSEGKK